MDANDIFAKKYELAFSRFQEQYKSLNRMSLFRSFILIISVLFLASYVAELEEIQSLRNKISADSAEYDYTVSYYLASHQTIEHEVYVPDDHAAALINLIGKLKSFLGEDLTVENQSGRLVREVLDQAKRKPEHIRIENTYLPNLSVPVSYSAMSLTLFYVMLTSFFYFSFRRRQLRGLLGYAYGNFRRLTGSDDLKHGESGKRSSLKTDSLKQRIIGVLGVGDESSPYRLLNSLLSMTLFVWLTVLVAHVVLAEGNRPTGWFFRILLIFVMSSIPCTVLYLLDEKYLPSSELDPDSLPADVEEF
jgi:hypothetical protein